MFEFEIIQRNEFCYRTNLMKFTLCLILLNCCIFNVIAASVDNVSNEAKIDLNNEETLKSLQAIIETVRKIRADADTNTTTIKNDVEETTTTAATTTKTSTTEDSNLLELESSFGGLGNVRENKQPEKLNGFYFLADVNSFLEVGDGDEKVVVRFNPKIGNPRNFIPIPGTRT